MPESIAAVKLAASARAHDLEGHDDDAREVVRQRGLRGRLLSTHAEKLLLGDEHVPWQQCAKAEQAADAVDEAEPARNMSRT